MTIGGDLVVTTNIVVSAGAFLLQTSAIGVPQAVVTEPNLDLLDLSDAFEDGQPNLFSLLRWDYRLVETLYGRDDDLGLILAWAESGSKAPSARLIAGEGGAGKTRLAAHAAQILRDRGWTAGFLPRHRNKFDFSVQGKGLFLILDYPEEQPERTAAILKDLAERKSAPYPLRILFLSRRPFAAWEGETTMLQGRFGTQEIASPASLSVEESARLVGEAASKVAAQIGNQRPDLNGARAWLAKSSFNRLPLYATAAAIHAALSPSEAFGLSGAELMRNLAARELDRVRPASEALGLGRSGLETLLALGVVADGLNESAIGQLARAGLRQGAGSDLISKLAGSAWWRCGRLMRLEPDPPAAAFVDLALFGSSFPQGRNALPEWLFIACRENAASFGNRLARVLHDLHELRRSESAGEHPLERRLQDMLDEDPTRSAQFEAVARSDVPVWAANFAARVALILADVAGDPEVKALFLNNAASYLFSLGRQEEAHKAADEAASLYRSLAAARPEAFTPDLAGSLNNLAAVRSKLGSREEALSGGSRGGRSLSRACAGAPRRVRAQFGHVVQQSRCHSVGARALAGRARGG